VMDLPVIAFGGAWQATSAEKQVSIAVK
jgi:hypothetical protein